MGCLSSTSKLCTALLLMAVNLVLLAGGIVVLVASLHAKDSGWVDVIETYWSHTNALLTALEVIGAVIIGLAALGTLAACCRWRAGLLLYAVVVFLVLVLFAVIAGVAFAARHTSEDWKTKSYPAASDETSIKREFDRVYCYAQGAYVCNEMNATEAASIFYPDVANSTLLSAVSDLKGVNAMCDVLLPLVPSIKSVCDGCTAAKEFENFTSVLDWANDECPRTSSTLLWCGTFLATSNETSVSVGTAPYSQCRPEFLDLVSTTTLTLGVGSVIVCAGALLIILLSCFLRRRERREQSYENVQYADAPANGQGFGTPQTSQPYYSNQHVTQEPLYAKV